MSVSIIGVSGDQHVQVFEDAPHLAQLQDMVGGYIEVINLGKQQMVVNEDGLSLNLPPNKAASMLAECLIVGPAVLLDGKHVVT